MEFVEIEKSFDPNEWNEYSQITPPENTQLILKEVGNNWLEFYAVKYKNGKFYMADTYGEKTEVQMGTSLKYFVKELPL